MTTRRARGSRSSAAVATKPPWSWPVSAVGGADEDTGTGAGRAIGVGAGSIAGASAIGETGAPSEPAPSEPAPSEPAPSEPAPSETGARTETGGAAGDEGAPGRDVTSLPPSGAPPEASRTARSRRQAPRQREQTCAPRPPPEPRERRHRHDPRGGDRPGGWDGRGDPGTVSGPSRTFPHATQKRTPGSFHAPHRGHAVRTMRPRWRRGRRDGREESDARVQAWGEVERGRLRTGSQAAGGGGRRVTAEHRCPERIGRGLKR